MTEVLLSSIGIKLFDYIQSAKNFEVIKRLFIQECKYNISLLLTIDWNGNDKNFSKYLIMNLKSDISSFMLCNYKNDFLIFSKKQLNDFLKINSTNSDYQEREIIIQIVNKILVLKVIADIPDN